MLNRALISFHATFFTSAMWYWASPVSTSHDLFHTSDIKLLTKPGSSDAVTCSPRSCASPTIFSPLFSDIFSQKQGKNPSERKLNLSCINMTAFSHKMLCMCLVCTYKFSDSVTASLDSLDVRCEWAFKMACPPSDTKRYSGEWRFVQRIYRRPHQSGGYVSFYVTLQYAREIGLARMFYVVIITFCFTLRCSTLGRRTVSWRRSGKRAGRTCSTSTPTYRLLTRAKSRFFVWIDRHVKLHSLPPQLHSSDAMSLL